MQKSINIRYINALNYSKRTLLLLNFLKVNKINLCYTTFFTEKAVHSTYVSIYQETQNFVDITSSGTL